MIPAVHQLHDRSGNTEALLHSNSCTLAYFRQNLLLGIKFQGVLQQSCKAVESTQARNKLGKNKTNYRKLHRNYSKNISQTGCFDNI